MFTLEGDLISHLIQAYGALIFRFGCFIVFLPGGFGSTAGCCMRFAGCALRGHGISLAVVRGRGSRTPLCGGGSAIGGGARTTLVRSFVLRSAPGLLAGL